MRFIFAKNSKLSNHIIDLKKTINNVNNKYTIMYYCNKYRLTDSA
jgi:hypothetical protein